MFTCLFSLFACRLCEDLLVYSLFHPQADIEKYSGIDRLNGWIKKYKKYSLGQTILYTVVIQSIYMCGKYVSICVYLCVVLLDKQREGKV